MANHGNMRQAIKSPISLADYNQLEEAENARYEFHGNGHGAGEVFAMAGGDPKHGVIANNIGGMLRSALFDKACTVFNSDVKFHIAAADKSLYPDVSVVCGTPNRSAQDSRALSNPILVVEVLSPSTEAYDRGSKFHFYSQLPSLREYVLVETESWKVETRYRHSPEEKWQLDWFAGKDTEVVLRSIDVSLTMAELYHRTEGL